MIKHANRNSFSAPLRVAAVAAIAVAATACGSGPTDREGSGPRDTGTYPNLNIPPKKAAPQFTDGQHDAAVTELTQKRVGSQTPQADIPGDESGPLSDLARTHGRRALDEIEKGQ